MDRDLFFPLAMVSNSRTLAVDEAELVDATLLERSIKASLPCGGANGERGREEVGLVTGSLRKKLVNFYVDAVDGYDDTTA